MMELEKYMKEKMIEEFFYIGGTEIYDLIKSSLEEIQKNEIEYEHKEITSENVSDLFNYTEFYKLLRLANKEYKGLFKNFEEELFNRSLLSFKIHLKEFLKKEQVSS